jgi:hypothetical protein
MEKKISKAKESLLKKDDIKCPINQLLMLSYVTDYDKLEKMNIQGSELKPEWCDVLKGDVTYFSYGMPFYKRKCGHTQNINYYPVVFVLKPSVNKAVDYYFPFDSGAICSGLFGKDGELLKDIMDYRVKSNPDKIVSAFYGTNDNYVHGKILEKCPCKDEKARIVYSLISSSAMGEDIDQRLRTVECVIRDVICVRDEIIWMAYPVYLWDVIEEIIFDNEYSEYENIGKYAYSTDWCELPGGLVTTIKKEFEKVYEKYIQDIL